MKIVSRLKAYFSGLINGKNKLPEDVKNFYENIHKHAFPGGQKQIREETAALQLALKNKYSYDFVNTVLLYATAKFYYQLLPPARFNPESFVEELIFSKKIDRQDAVRICNFIQLKFKESEKS